MKRTDLFNVLPALAIVCLFFTGGCASDGEFGDRTAVLIYNQKSETIIETTTQVFVRNGYTPVTVNDDDAVYERKGTTAQNMAYGSWMSGKVTEQATVTVEPYAKGAKLLIVKAELLSNKDDDFFREEKKMSRRARKPFQEMINQVADMLGGFPTVDNGN
jgi:hypothetical protein